MLTLIFIALILYLYGMHKTLVVYMAVTASVIMVFLCLATAILASTFFWPSEVRLWTFMGNSWTLAFIGRETFSFQESVFIPIIFFFDAGRVFFELLFKYTNIVIIVCFGTCIYNLLAIWATACRFLRASRNTPATMTLKRIGN